MIQVLYDDACGFCRRWVPFWSRVLAAHGIRTEGTIGLPDLRVVDDLGRLHDGAEAYRFVFRRIPWAAPFGLLAEAPVLRRIFDAGYRGFARLRYRVSAACGLSGGRAAR